MYTFEGRVRYSETDEFGKLSVTGIMNYLQDCSTFQSTDIGMGLGYLEKTHRTWLLSSWQIVIGRYPEMGEEIVIGTWPYEFKGIYGYRNFTIQDKKGNYLVKANSVWFFYDTVSQIPVRAQEKDIRGYQAGETEKLMMDYAPRKIHIPDRYTEYDPLTVAKHHIDTNHHVNNAKYVEIARELLPDQFTVGEIRVEYKRAAVCGDVIIPRVSTLETGYVISLCSAQGEPYAVVLLTKQGGNKN